MALRAQLFRGDARLEAAAVFDASHVVPGNRGPFVGKIQIALNRLDGAGLDVDGVYGPLTANAVLAYKRKRKIINRSYQSTPDNIVGKMTMASLDDELQRKGDLDPLEITVTGDKPIVNVNPVRGRPLVRLAFGFDAALADTAPANLRFSTKFSRWSPLTTGKVRCAQTGKSSLAICTNEPDPSREPPQSVNGKIAFLSDIAGPKNLGAFPKAEEGGRVPLTEDPHEMRLETFRPGDATITVTRGDTVRMLIVEVRQDAKGRVNRPPLTKLTAKSRFFSASEKEGGEEDPNKVFTGRPVNPKRGGRLINLGGDTETPEFEDYQVDLDHSFDQKGGFRPWVDDFEDPKTFVPSQSASHITMRGTPLLPPFLKAIKRIAQPGCRFTFEGSERFLATIRSELPGRELETPFFEEAHSQFDSRHVFLAWEIQ
jgi:hypothetical protein